MLIAILHNAVPPDALAADRDVLVQAEVVAAALRSLGHEPVLLACTLDLEALGQCLRETRPEAVFNLVESLGGSDGLSFLAIAILDWLGLPYTGAPMEAMRSTTHKVLAKERLRPAGLPTPDWFTAATNGTAASAFDFGQPYIVKAVCEHASFGLDEDSVMPGGDEAAVRASVTRHAARLKAACYAEQYVEGREFNLSLLAAPDGCQVLPPAEIDFSAFPGGKPRVVGQRAKWADGSFEFCHTPRRFDHAIDDGPLVQELCRLAAECWKLFGLRGYARVDFRVDAAGRPWILEINANPCLSPDAGFAAALERASISFPEAVERILNQSSRVARP